MMKWNSILLLVAIILALLFFYTKPVNGQTTTTTLDDAKLPWPLTNVCAMDINKIPVQHRAKINQLKTKAGCP